ncbi:MAG: transcription-repair coupling factor (mfd) [Acidobacteriaceae bacterium]|nr:transcription-repair coupling factor (mfd) [Acidobacteriaceae bacterium]
MILPFVREILADAEKSSAFQRAATLLKARAGRTRVSGLTPTAKALHLALLHRAVGKPLLVVVPNNRAAEDLLPVLQSVAELSGAARPDAIVMLPAFDVLPFENLSPHPEIQEERATALWKIASGEVEIVIAPMEAASMRLQSAEFYADLTRIVRRAETIDPEQLIQHLNVIGYTAADVVEMPGQYALRGGILDVYPPEAERPVRVEFFGDDVESIRKFDPASQRSSTPVDEVALLPLSETPGSETILATIHARLSGSRISGSEQSVTDAMSATGVTVFPGWEFYASVAGADQNLFDLMPNALVIVDEPSAVKAESDRWWEKVIATHDRSGVGSLVTPEEIFIAPEAWEQLVQSHAGADIEELNVATAEAEGDVVDFRSQPTMRFHGSVPAMVEEVKKLSVAGERVIFAAPNMGEVERLADIFSEYGVHFRLGSRVPKAGTSETFLDETAYATGDLSAATIVRAAIPHGVVLPDSRLVLFGAQDLFDDSEVVVKRPSRQKSVISTFLSDFRDLAIGDYVVHVEHGIAEYRGLKEIAQGDGETKGEFMLLEFAEAAKLYVPLTRLDLIQKYRSTEGGRPPLSRLGGTAWAKTKARVKKAMQDMADELLKLYAERKTAVGHAFAPDNQFQREFEDAFEHNETNDQVTSVADIKRDMESTLPMDRLLCGDVGYGKTEVAMRAAFKAVNDSKQVAVLAPTTVLAFQHFETFKQRFAAFPITIEMISRFRTTKQQKEIIEKVEQGKIDILIGTHRLLSRDLKFPDLGLLVVDEEQRFGVRHKERLKQMKKEVDVLTMSATPIPRTLHMSLVGLRDMSVIETPPRDRIAIQTVVAAFDEKLIKSAIEHELERGGQAYFVHNRVESIYEIAAKLKELVPKARVIVGHGQMSEGELEKTMLAFMRHEADVLVATTIIENGLDIPLCNTIMINRADRHGLSELYQLRGRVGRSNRRSYAYLLIPAEQELTPIARRRLAALKEFSDLGAGFKIAALDLELRGAGNMLGGEQSGHVEAIGFEMYTTMLERTVREIKGEQQADTVSTQLNLALNLRIPNDYVAEENQRLRMYKRIAGVENEDQLADVRAELVDRYGEPPAPVRNLLDATALKMLGQRVGVAGIDRKQNIMHIKFTESAEIDPAKLAGFVASNKGAQFSPGGTLKFVLKTTAADAVIATVRDLLHQLAAQPVRV